LSARSAVEDDGDVRLRIPGGVPALLAYVDPQQRLVYAGDLLQDWFGLAPAEAAGRHLRQVVGEAAYERIGPQAEAALTGCPVTFEAALPQMRGEARQVRASFTPDLGPEGGVRGLVAMLVDIDAEKAVEAELRLQQRVLATLREGVSVWSEAGTFVYANAAMEAMFDYGPGELAGAPIEVLRREPRLREVAEAGGDAGWEGELSNLSRQARPFTTRARVSPIDAGGARCWVCIEEDVTEHQRAENRFRALTEAKTAFAEAGLDFAAASQVAARRLAELVGDACTFRVLSSDGESLEPVAMHHRDPEAYEWMKRLLAPEPLQAGRLAARAFASAEPLLLNGVTGDQLLAELGGGGPGWDEYLARFAPHSLLLAPMRVHGRPIGLLLLGRSGPDGPYTEDDRRFTEAVAGRAALTLESARLYEAVREASRLKDEFLSTLSHELRTPLNAIVGWAHVLRAEDLDEATRSRAVAIINRNAEVQSRMIADVLDVSRIISGRLQLEIGSVDLEGLVRGCLDGIASEAAVKGVEVRATVEAGMAPVAADEERLRQVLCHLLANALRFTPPDGSVGVTLRSVGAGVELVVEDDGPGVDPAFLPFVFDRFRQADSSSTRSHGGLGLGLAIVRHVVELHGGAVEARNREGGPGAVFTVRLPRKAPAVQVALSALRRPAGALGGMTPPKGTPLLTGVRVLAVDDDAASLEVLGVLLGRWGAEVELASSAKEAFARLKTFSPQVLLVDIEMPGEDGYSFVRRLRQLPPERGGRIPAAALTAYASAEDRARALDAGFAAHVRKPVAPAELAAVIADLAAAQPA
jgi:PAS domain S-box-containing protein